jgi:hypothetical protein
LGGGFPGNPFPLPGDGCDFVACGLTANSFTRDANGNLQSEWSDFCWLRSTPVIGWIFGATCSAVILGDERAQDTRILNATKADAYDAWKTAFDNSNETIVKTQVFELEQQNLYIDGLREAQAMVDAAGHDNPVSGPLGLATDQRGLDRDDNNRKIRDLLQGAGLPGIQPHPPK